MYVDLIVIYGLLEHFLIYPFKTGLAWTFDMRRMCVLIAQAWKFEEPVLLVGETGCGKTTAVQVLAKVWKAVKLRKISLFCLHVILISALK